MSGSSNGGRQGSGSLRGARRSAQLEVSAALLEVQAEAADPGKQERQDSMGLWLDQQVRAAGWPVRAGSAWCAPPLRMARVCGVWGRRSFIRHGASYHQGGLCVPSALQCKAPTSPAVHPPTDPLNALSICTAGLRRRWKQAWRTAWRCRRSCSHLPAARICQLQRLAGV